MTSAPPHPSAQIALFLDIDGTLLEFTDTPSQTMADAKIKTLLAEATAKLGGALAFVSGREIRTMDALFAPLKLPAAGLHGVERRDAAGKMHGEILTDGRLNLARLQLQALAARYPGAIVEDKGRNVAVHFRLAPDHAAAIRQGALDIARALAQDFEVQEGVMLVEIKPRGFSKGTAIAAFLQETPFRGRLPVFVGDDLTDTVGFRAVEAHGGYSIGVGPRVEGTYHLHNVAAVRRWLGELVTPHV